MEPVCVCELSFIYHRSEVDRPSPPYLYIIHSIQKMAELSFPYLMNEVDQKLNRARVDFCSARSYSAWQCSVDGTNKKRISFVAVPGVVAGILEDLSYEDFVPGNGDTLVMDVCDGIEGQRLDGRDHQAWTNNWRTESASHFSTGFRGCRQWKQIWRLKLVALYEPGLQELRIGRY